MRPGKRVIARRVNRVTDCAACTKCERPRRGREPWRFQWRGHRARTVERNKRARVHAGRTVGGILGAFACCRRRVPCRRAGATRAELAEPAQCVRIAVRSLRVPLGRVVDVLHEAIGFGGPIARVVGRAGGRGGRACRLVALARCCRLLPAAALALDASWSNYWRAEVAAACASLTACWVWVAAWAAVLAAAATRQLAALSALVLALLAELAAAAV